MTNIIEKPKATLREQLQSDGMKKHLAMALPKHLTPDRMVRVVLTAITRTPKLAECDQASFFKALFECSQMGLEPDGRRAHLIPFENKKKGIVECQLIVDYKGLAELAFRSGRVKSIHAQEIRRGDLFIFDRGQVLNHVPHFLRNDAAKPKEAGEIFAYYCIVEMEGDAHKCEVMSLEEVNAIRDKSQGYQAFKKGWAKTSVWQDYPIELGKKTVFKRLSKWLPLSAEFRTAIVHDDQDSDDGARTTVDEITSLLSSDVPLLSEPIADDGEIIPFDMSIMSQQFADCKTQQEAIDVERTWANLYPEQDAAIASMALERREEIKGRK